MKQQIFCGNNLDLLKNFPANHFDAIVTDPPYGLGKEPDANQMLQAWITDGYLEVNGSGFMGKEWDAFVPQPIFWKEVFRVLKHGGHVVSFFGTRTYDWGVMAMRLAGFEIRDQIQWIYGSGFPKSHNISKAIDKMPKGHNRLFEFSKLLKEKRESLNLSIMEVDKLITDGSTMYSFFEGRKVNETFKIYAPNEEHYEKIKKLFSIDGWDDIVENNLQKVADGIGSFGYQKEGDRWQSNRNITITTTEQAKQWDGWGTALKPANEPIVLARKPLEKGLSIAENVLKWGTGGINIDGCRVSVDPAKDDMLREVSRMERKSETWQSGSGFKNENNSLTGVRAEGRFPANLILTHHPDCVCVGTKKVKAIKGGMGENSMGGMGKNGIYGKYSLDKLGANAGGLGDENGEETIENWNCHEDCPIKIMDEQSGVLNKQGLCKSDNKSGWQNKYVGGNKVNAIERKLYLDAGGASRFFYCAKASKSERNKGLNEFDIKRPDNRDEKGMGSFEQKGVQPQQNFHPTVKPVALMRYLVRLITPPNGIVLDPFNGSGTTGVACKLEDFNYVGLELDAEYCKIAEARILGATESDYKDEMIVADDDAKNETDNSAESQLSLF